MRVCALAAGGHISGGHYNPAVSLTLLIRAGLSLGEFVLYVIAQFAGAALGGSLASVVPGVMGYPLPGPDLTAALVAEGVPTFALCHTVLHTATVKPASESSYYGISIGFTVLSGAISIGGVSGCCLNPAVAVLTWLSGNYSLYNLIVYTAGPLSGALVAGVLFRFITHAKEVNTRSNPAWSCYVIEFIGTFLLCYTVATAVAPSNKTKYAALSIGSMLMAQVYAGGATSGANYNPAVTLSIYLHSRLKGSKDVRILKALAYILVQLAGGAAAMYVASLTVDTIGQPSDKTRAGPRSLSPAMVFDVIPVAMLVELIGTFFLCFVVLQVAASKNNGGQDFFGLAIGFTVVSMAITLGGTSGGAFNPAVGMLALSNGLGAAKPMLINYFAGPFLGSIIATLIFRATNGEEYGRRGYLEMS